MGNTIWVEQGGERTASMTLSNAVTGHFLAMLLLSGSVLAQTGEERDLIVFLDWHDQHWRGRGNVDFCLNEMPWCIPRFTEQVGFMEAVVDGALMRTGWEKVADWTPEVLPYVELLEQFRSLLKGLSSVDLRPISEDDWLPPGDRAICPKHGVLTYNFADDLSCLVCHI